MFKPVFAAACLALFVASYASAEKSSEPSIKVGDKLQDFTLKTINPEACGKRLISADSFFTDASKPGKAMILSFFATYCEPCKKELPFLQALHSALADKGLGIMVVSIDNDQKKADELKALVEKHKLSYPGLWDRFNIVAKRYGITRPPCMLMIDPQQRISMVNIGYNNDHSADLIEKVRAAMQLSKDEPSFVELSKRYAHKP